MRLSCSNCLVGGRQVCTKVDKMLPEIENAPMECKSKANPQCGSVTA